MKFKIGLIFFLAGVLCGIISVMIIRGNTLIEVAHNTGQNGYQISYRSWYGQIKYYYPITESGKDRFLNVMGMEE